MKNSIAYLTIIFFLLFLVSCKRDEPEQAIPETGVVTDIEGNTYKTVKIGNQWWMAEDLKAQTYSNGILIFEKQTNNEWSKDTSGSFCIQENVTLYNWYAVKKEIAPAGWHVPTDEDWKKLEIHLGMATIDASKSNWRGLNEGDKLKAKSIWFKYKDVWGTNETGFSAKPTGCRLFDGVSGSPGLPCVGFWWTIDEESNDRAFYRHLDYKNSNVFRYAGPKNYGFAIRCVKD